MAAQSSIFPRYYLSMIQAGEAGGTLHVVLARLADFMERSQATVCSFENRAWSC